MQKHPWLSRGIGLAALFAHCTELGASNDLDDQDLPHCPLSRSLTHAPSFISHVTLKIVLVEFSDVKHRTLPRPYTRRDFENLLGSSGTYVSPQMKSPDGDDVFGSVADYYAQMSNGRLAVTGRVVNSVDSNDFPLWLTLPHSKSYYQSFSCNRTPMFPDVDRAAASAGIDLSRDPVQGIIVVIIYAGNVCFSGGGLNPVVPITCDEYQMSERQGRPYGEENPSDRFSRIGIHCHEIGHCLGLGHSTSSRAELMDAGDRNGPDREGGAPAPLDPGTRCRFGWITPTLVSAQEIDTLRYSLSAPIVYRINCVGRPGFFLFELRRFDGLMSIGSASCPDYNNSAFFPPAWPHAILRQGIFAWRYVGDIMCSPDDHGLIYASGLLGSSYPEHTPTETDDGVPFPGAANVRVLSPWSDTRDPEGSTAGHNNLFVPSTSSTPNVGMELLADIPDSGYAVVKFFADRPIDASPAKPEMYAASLDADRVRLTWSANREPDLAGKPYRIYAKYAGPAAPALPPWTLLATTDSTWYNDVQHPPCSLATYRICAVDTQGQESAPSQGFSVAFDRISTVPQVDTGNQVDGSPSLAQNYPNPFNPITRIRYTVGGNRSVPSSSSAGRDSRSATGGPEGEGLGVRGVSLIVCDVLGREVAVLVNERKAPGTYEMLFDASGLSSGVYFYRLSAGSFVQTRSMVVLK